jgi:hypothetical protein
MLHEHEHRNGTASIARKSGVGGRAFDPEVVAILGSAFNAVFADLGLSDRDDEVSLKAARRIIELAAAGERDPEKLRAYDPLGDRMDERDGTTHWQIEAPHAARNEPTRGTFRHYGRRPDHRPARATSHRGSVPKDVRRPKEAAISLVRTRCSTEARHQGGRLSPQRSRADAPRRTRTVTGGKDAPRHSCRGMGRTG